jgi:hypothetical protein
MNIHKHMEAIFVVTLAVIGVGSFALDSVPEANAQPLRPVERAVATDGQMAVVIIHAPKGWHHS